TPFGQPCVEHCSQSRSCRQVEDTLHQNQIRFAESPYVDPHAKPPPRVARTCVAAHVPVFERSSYQIREPSNLSAPTIPEGSIPDPPKGGLYAGQYARRTRTVAQTIFPDDGTKVPQEAASASTSTRPRPLSADSS